MKQSWWGRLKQGVQKSTSVFATGFKNVFKGKKLNEETLEALEELMITHDFGVEITHGLMGKIKQQKFERDTDFSIVQNFLYQEIFPILSQATKPFQLNNISPFVILVLGVNGAGKTTSIAKLAHYFQEQGHQISVCGADTFRAAAVDQLEKWCNVLNVPLFSSDKEGADPAGLCFDAYQKAKERGDHVLIIDTAGRLHNKGQLMDELKKIKRVLGKIDLDAPHASLLVLDGTTGQNAMKQVETFHETIGVDWLMINKLDSSAKGGIIIQIAQKLGLPIMGIGIGEGIEDFNVFDADYYTRNLLGIDK